MHAAVDPLNEPPRRRKVRAERLVITRYSCSFLLDEWDVELEWLSRALTPRAADDGEGSLIPVVSAR